MTLSVLRQSKLLSVYKRYFMIFKKELYYRNAITIGTIPKETFVARRALIIHITMFFSSMNSLLLGFAKQFTAF